jgi:protein TonB
MKALSENAPTKLIWVAGGAISLMLHTGGMWYLNQNNQPDLVSDNLPQAGSIKLIMSAAEPKAVSAPPILPMPIKPPAPVKKPPVEEKAKPASKPKPEQAIPIIDSQPVEKHAAIAEQKENRNPLARHNPAPLHERSAQRSAEKSAAVLEDEHFAELVKRIDKHKQYPRRAQKRNIEGRVSFILHLDSQGKLQSFEWINGNRLFYKSTLEAVRNSLPLPLPKGLNKMKYSLSLSYRLL